MINLSDVNVAAGAAAGVNGPVSNGSSYDASFERRNEMSIAELKEKTKSPLYIQADKASGLVHFAIGEYHGLCSNNVAERHISGELAEIVNKLRYVEYRRTDAPEGTPWRAALNMPAFAIDLSEATAY